MKFILYVVIATSFGEHHTNSVSQADFPTLQSCMAERDNALRYATSDGVSVHAECSTQAIGDAR